MHFRVLDDAGSFHARTEAVKGRRQQIALPFQFAEGNNMVRTACQNIRKTLPPFYVSGLHRCRDSWPVTAQF